jgi:hypothetical protein
MISPSIGRSDEIHDMFPVSVDDNGGEESELGEMTNKKERWRRRRKRT